MKSALSITEQVQKELQMYQFPSVPPGQDPVAWWWGDRDSLSIF